MWKECIIDATMGCRDGMFVFCPIIGDINGDFHVVTGMNYVGLTPPDGMKLVAIVHNDGQAAVEAFCKRYKTTLAVLKSVLSYDS